MPSEKRASYRITFEGRVLCLFDLKGEIPIEADIDQVLKDVMASGAVFEKILFRDRHGIWDEIQLRAGRFVGFRMLGMKTLQGALRKVGH